MERVGRGGAAWQRERVSKLIRRPRRAGVGLGPEEDGLRERRSREGQEHHQPAEYRQISPHHMGYLSEGTLPREGA
jgi:hypothetical protein